MKRFHPAVLIVSGLLVLTACGSTVQVRDTGVVAGNGRLDTPGVTGDGRAPDMPGAVVGGPSNSGGPVAQPGSVQPGEVGSSPGGAVDPSGGPQVVTPGTKTTKPLQIGVLITDTDSFQTAAGFPSYTKVRRDSVHAYIKAINAAGGVAGRKLTVVDATFSYTAASYDNEFESACQKFTRDNHVGAVIYDGVAYNRTFNTCLTKAGVPAFFMGVTGSGVGDSTDLANYPGLISVNEVSMDRRLQSILNKAIAVGFLRSGRKLGVVVETCPHNERAYDRTLAPIVKRNKITVFKTDVDCGHGSGDHGTGIGAVQAAVLRYRSEGVDSVMFVTTYENGVIYYFAQAAQAQGYAPQYLLFSPQADPERMAAYPREQLVKMRGFGGYPLQDVTRPPAPPPAQAAARRNCLTTLQSQGVTAGPGYARVALYQTCDAVGLLRRALTRSDGLGGTRHLVNALEQLATGFVSTMTLNGATRFGPGRHDGMDLTAVSAYQAKCECFAYITPPRPIS